MDTTTYSNIRQFADTASQTELVNTISIVQAQINRNAADIDFNQVGTKALSILEEELNARYELAIIASAGRCRLQA